MSQSDEPVLPEIAANLESIAKRLGESEREAKDRRQEENFGNQSEEGE